MLVKQNLFVKQDLLYKMAHNQVIQKYKISFWLQFWLQMIIRKHSWWLPNSWDSEHMEQGAARVHGAGMAKWVEPNFQIQEFHQVTLEGHLLR